MAVPLLSICQSEGIDENIAEYFRQIRGIWPVGVLASWVQDENTLDSIVAQFETGVELWLGTPRVVTVKYEGPGKLLLKACLKQLLDRARLMNATSLQLSSACGTGKCEHAGR